MARRRARVRREAQSLELSPRCRLSGRKYEVLKVGLNFCDHSPLALKASKVANNRPFTERGETPPPIDDLVPAPGFK